SRLRPQLSAYPALQAKANLVLIQPTANFNAFADPEKKLVIIPVMLCIETWYWFDAMMYLRSDPRLQQKTLDYLQYLTKRQLGAIARATGFDDDQLMPFNEFANRKALDLPESELQRSIAAREKMMVETLAFIIGHEIAHLVLGHKPYGSIPPDESRKQELEADNFSVELIKKSGFSVLGAVPSIQRFLAKELLLRRAGGDAMTHPRAECRLVNILTSSGDIKDLLKSPDRVKEYESQSGQLASELLDYLEEQNKECATDYFGATPLARIIIASKDSFASLRIGQRYRIDGENNWDSRLSIEGSIRGCTVWSGNRDLPARVSCLMTKPGHKDAAAARELYFQAVDLVKATVPSSWKQQEARNSGSVWSRRTTFSGPDTDVSINLVGFESTGSQSVTVLVQMTPKKSG
ncbi:MAG: hypothetical protein ING33_05830, partial [Rhodocyclaceae bacterium]|nr:hypothetical protein [Rhodocyclaceae bacterium]